MSIVEQIRPPRVSSEGARATSLSEHAFREIRKHILSGDIPPGKKLAMEALTRTYSLSSSPLREALNRLVGEGLVTSDENRGFRAAPMSADDLRDITNYRLIIEPQALALSIEQGEDDWEGRVVSALHQLERVEARTPPESLKLDDLWTERHKEYHMALLSGMKSPRILATCSSLFDQAERYRRSAVRNRPQRRDSGREHQAMVDAALARKTELAIALLRDHISATARIAISTDEVTSA